MCTCLWYAYVWYAAQVEYELLQALYMYAYVLHTYLHMSVHTYVCRTRGALPAYSTEPVRLFDTVT
jgi:hypothetical protein